MVKFIAVSYYTPDYESHAIDLGKTCEEFGLTTHIQPIQDLGGWQKNCQYKPHFLLKMLDLYVNRNIVWLDADARVRAYPSLFEDLHGDVAVHYRRGQELLSGTIWLGNTVHARALMNEWAAEMLRRTTTWDQKCLDWAIQRIGVSLWAQKLPASYCKIFDRMKSETPETVIEHMQASRSLKKVSL